MLSDKEFKEINARYAFLISFLFHLFIPAIQMLPENEFKEFNE